MPVLGGAVLAFIVLEIISIVLMASWIGGGLTLLLMLAGFIGGMTMLRRVGLAGVVMMNATLHQRKNVSLYQMLWPIRYGVAAFLLMSPGFVSDILTLLLLFPFRGKSSTASNHSFHNNDDAFRRYSGNPNQDDDIIEGDYTVQNDTNTRSDTTKNFPPERK